MSKARVLAKLGWRVYIVKVEVGKRVDSLDAVVRGIWRREFTDIQPCEYLAEGLLREIESLYPDCFVKVKVLAMGFQESASIDNGSKLVVQYEEDRQTTEASGRDGELGSEGI